MKNFDSQFLPFVFDFLLLKSHYLSGSCIYLAKNILGENKSVEFRRTF